MRARPPSLVLLLAATMAGCGEGDPPPQQALPCEVNAVLVDVCQKCHSSPPRDGVPISLVTYEDTQAPYTDGVLYRGTPVWKVMGDLVRQGLMPQPPVILAAPDRATILDWLDRGAPPAPGGTKCP
jgi:hypothetical protein